VKKNLFLLLAAFSLVTSCGLLGIHMKVQNPSGPGKLEEVSEEMRLLANENSLRAGYDVTFYNLDIAFDARGKSLSGWVEIRGTALRDMDSLQIDLHSNLKLDELRFQNREGTQIDFSRKYRAVVFAVPQRIRTGEKFSFHVKYHGKPVIADNPPWKGGTVWKRDKNKNAWLGVACETEGASVWFPCKDLTNDEPDSALMRYSIPDNGLTAVGNGKLEQVEAIGGNRSFTWRVHYPINLYNLTYYVGDFVKIEDRYVGVDGKELLLTHYVLRENEVKAREHFKKVKENIRVYEEVWGPYAFYRDGFKLVESPYAGMEHQSAIAYGNKYKLDLYGVEDYIILHESGHEWFGNAISAADLADVWLQEGITTYGESVYLERQYGQSIALRHLLMYRMMIKNKHPLVGPVGLRYFDFKDGDVYVKGAWVLHTLRYQLQNDSLFFNILRTFYQENSLKVTDSKQLVKTVNRLSGENYDWFFEQYLYRNTVPLLEYQIENNTLYYRWIDVDTAFDKLRIAVKIEGVDEFYSLIPATAIKKVGLPKGAGTDIVSFGNSYALFGYKSSNKLSGLYQ
jgi:aminopeptidase N